MSMFGRSWPPIMQAAAREPVKRDGRVPPGAPPPPPRTQAEPPPARRPNPFPDPDWFARTPVDPFPMRIRRALRRWRSRPRGG